MRLFKVEITVAVDNDNFNADQVQQTLCEFLHEEVINFTDVDGSTVVEFTNVGEPKEFKEEG